MIAHINIGSNRGDSLALIERAVAAISSVFPHHSTKVSSLFFSPPWGYESANDFVNIGMLLEGPAVEPVVLLRTLLNIEKNISGSPHRNPDGSYRDREIDIDLIAVDSAVIESEELTLPHPRMHLRPFVLVPMTETHPDWRHPLLGLTPSEMLDTIE